MRKEYDFSGARRGAIELPDPRKTRITIRLDTKILKWFWQRVDEAGGGNYQTMINEVLKNYIESENKKIRRYPGGLQGEREVRYQMEGEGEGSELKGRGYDLKENIRE
ncbi:MAG: BrnA antitoxin family protein [Syntrophales bacterium]|nr:BrnA antitoxin family protein [Syntrophales bacterium]